MNRAALEYRAVLLLGALLLGALISAVISARAEVRDDLRRQDITNLKHAVEQYFNQHEYYPTPPAGAPACTAWLFGASSPLLREKHIDAIPHDVREYREYYYTYCATSSDRTGQTQGYYLQAQLERPEREQRSFDEDEARKFHYRILHDGEAVLYRVCGGNEKQCEQ